MRAPTDGTWEDIFQHPCDMSAHCVGPGGGALVVFASTCTCGAGVVVVDVTAVSVSKIPILKLLDWGG